MSAGRELDWVRDAIFYEIFPDRFRNGDPSNDPPGAVPWGSTPTRDSFFGGDLRGVLEKMDYLEDLGITALYLTPIFRAGTNHRYDTHDYLDVDPALGNGRLLREVVQEAHRRGIRVILDGVFNHSGDGFWAFRDLAQRGAASPYQDWYFPRSFPIRRDPPNYQTCGGAAYLPKLNVGNPELRRYLLDVGAHWLREADIDGWRLDVPWKVPLDFWEEFREIVKRERHDAYLVGELWRDSSPWLGVFDGAMNYPLRARLLEFCILDALDAEDLVYETQALFERIPDPTLMLNLLGSHDVPRLLTLARGDEDRVRLALTALFTFPGAPMLYYGDEIGLEGGDDPDCRRSMPWDEARWNRRIREAVRGLARLRRDQVALRRGSWEPLLAENRTLVYRRCHEGQQVIVVLNAGPFQYDFAVPLPAGAPTEWLDGLTQVRYVTRGSALEIPRLPTRTGLTLLPASSVRAA